jgi:hypothetical protein
VPRSPLVVAAATRFLIHAKACILHLHLNRMARHGGPFAVPSAGPQRQCPAEGHGIYGVENEIDERLTDFAFDSHDGRPLHHVERPRNALPAGQLRSRLFSARCRESVVTRPSPGPSAKRAD